MVDYAVRVFVAGLISALALSILAPVKFSIGSILACTWFVFIGYEMLTAAAPKIMMVAGDMEEEEDDE